MGTATCRTRRKIEQFWDTLRQADTVLIGAGAGLSTSAGFQYDGERFYRHFADFSAKYGFQDMYAGGFYPYDTLEEYWAYWSRYIHINRYTDPPKSVYQDLFSLVKDKDYFVLTTNVDHCFPKAGFDKTRLFYTQGDYGLWQCAKPCCQKTYDNQAAVEEMLRQQTNMRIPADLIPHCPVCGAPMTMNLRADSTFVQDAGWYRACDRYTGFVRRHQRTPVLYLELGVGMNTPSIIKFNFWQQVAQNPRAQYVSINQQTMYLPDEISGRSLCLTGDIGQILQG